MQAGCSVDESNGCSKLQEEAADHRQMSSGDRDHPGTLAMGRLGGFLDRKDPEYTSTNGNSQELEFEGAEVSPLDFLENLQTGSKLELRTVGSSLRFFHHFQEVCQAIIKDQVYHFYPGNKDQAHVSAKSRSS